MNNNVLKLILFTGIFCGTNFGMYQGTYNNEIDYRPYIPMPKDEDWGKHLKARRQQWQRAISENNNRIVNEKILEGYGMICAAPVVLCCVGLSVLLDFCPVRNRWSRDK